MKRNFLRRNALMILGLATATVPGFSKNPVTDAHLSVRMLDYVNLPADERDELETTAHRIYAQAGIQIDFLECLSGGVEVNEQACRAPLGATDVDLRILLPKLAPKGEEVGYAAMGREGGAYITVYLDPGQHKARVSNLSNGAFLGHVVAHEIGHLLLGPNSHSPSGIMRAAWRTVDEEWAAKGAMLFDSGQARKMRASLAARERAGSECR